MEQKFENQIHFRKNFQEIRVTYQVGADIWHKFHELFSSLKFVFFLTNENDAVPKKKKKNQNILPFKNW